MTETMLRTALGEKILRHWRENCPQMVRDLEQTEPAGPGGVRSAGDDGRPAVRTGVGARK